MVLAFLLAVLTLLCNISSSAKFNPEGLPTIIWWTDLLYPHPGKSAEIKCPHGGRCLISPRRRKHRLSQVVSGAFLFYGTDFSGSLLPLPRLPHHQWALLHEESPMNNFLFSHQTGIELFNVTATFSRFSDFPLVLQHLPSLEFLERAPLPLQEKDRMRKGGLAPVLYLQSHCGVASDRDAYVRELMRYLEVDSYGACLHNRNLPLNLATPDTHNDEELFSFIAKYKFHLAFENALCEDYITEKLYRALHVGSVPIYRGSPSVRDWAPSNHSIIVVDDFSSPKELANFVKELDHNDALYSKYLRYKEDGITNQLLKKSLLERNWGVSDPSRTDFIQDFECYVCDRIQNSDSTSVANRKHMNCHQPHVAFISENEGQHQTAFILKEEVSHQIKFIPKGESHHEMANILKNPRQMTNISKGEGSYQMAFISKEKSHLQTAVISKEERYQQTAFIPEDEGSRNTCKSPKEENRNCHPLKETAPDEWSIEDWEESFFFAYDEARAIHLMIHSGENDSTRFMEYITKIKYPD